MKSSRESLALDFMGAMLPCMGAICLCSCKFLLCGVGTGGQGAVAPPNVSGEGRGNAPPPNIAMYSQ